MKNQEEQNWRGTFFFDPADLIYNDHFPASPVVPGSLIINAFLQALKRIDSRQRVSVVKNFRYVQFVTPGEYPFCITRKKNEYFCELFDAEAKTLVTGKLR